ncbi:hypothetical protein [Thermococcus sp.]|uniref:hypothetical protein n=1 Tax=Thermococcus sp. TaxID=35749 RepID=UPI0026319CDC|nr:hypothetical protein [Thermococcus sp.]
MQLLTFQHDSASVEDVATNIVLKSREILSHRQGFISSAKIDMSFGAFMNLTVTLVIDDRHNMEKGVVVEHSTGKNREDAINNAVVKVNGSLPDGARVVAFDVGTYITPVTRRTYAVVVAVYNAPLQKRDLSEYSLGERRSLLKRVLREFDYNPKVLNISEIARVFGVSRDSIYYDIEQILKEAMKKG